MNATNSYVRITSSVCLALLLIGMMATAIFADLKIVKGPPGVSASPPQSQQLPRSIQLGGELHTICKGKLRCYKKHLEAMVKEQGTEEALKAIDQVVLNDQTAKREAHNLTHHVGRVSYQHLKDVTAVMFKCTAVHQSGCYHGALEAYLSKKKSRVRSKDVVAICSSKLEAEKGRFAYFNCFHGLGHGLTMHLNHDMKKALTLCDALKMTWDRESCYGGVFMETVVTAISGSEHHAGHHGDKHAAHKPKLLDPKDPLYPCSAIEKKYWRECYMMQTSIILHLTHYNFGKAFLVCDGAPEGMIPSCYQSMGRDISGHTLRDIKQSIDLCELGHASYQGRCYVGVVKNFINVKGQASEDAFEFCRQTPTTYKGDCHVAIGEELFTLYRDPKKRASECDRSVKNYVNNCGRGARLRPDRS